MPSAPAAGYVKRTGTNPSVESVSAIGTGEVGGHVIAGALVCATTSNSGTAEVCNTSPTFTPVAGDSIIFQADIANTDAFTLNVNSLGAKSVTKRGTTALVAGDIAAAPFQVLLTYDGTQWEMQGQGAKALVYSDAAILPRALGCGVGDPAGSALATGVLCYIPVPVACTIASWDILVDSGTATAGIWQVATGTAIPTVSNSIVASAAPAISTGRAIHSTTMTSWATTHGGLVLAPGDILGFNLTTTSGPKYIYVGVNCQ
jgi:hypothetical protein